MGPCTGVVWEGFVHGGWIWEGFACRSSENILVFESLRMALVITSNMSSYAVVTAHFPYFSRIGVVMTLVLKLWPSIIVARRKHVSFKPANCCSLWIAAVKLLR